MMKWNKFLLAIIGRGSMLLLVMGLSACADTLKSQDMGAPQVMLVEAEQHSGMGWYAVRFSIP